MGAADLNSEPHSSTGHLYHPRQLRLYKEEIPDRNELRARESLRFCFLPLSLWQLHAMPFLGDPEARQVSFASAGKRFRKGLERGAWGRQWQLARRGSKRDENCPGQSPDLEMIRGNRAPRLPKHPEDLGSCCISASLVCYHLRTEKSEAGRQHQRWPTARGGSCSFGTCCRVFRPESPSFHAGSWHTGARTGAGSRGGTT